MKNLSLHLNNSLIAALIIIASFFNLLNAQNTYKFITAGAAGQFGPTQSQLDSAYLTTNLSALVKSENGIQTWTVPVTGFYKIEARGAQGGGDGITKFGGKGTSMKGEFYFAAGSVLKILVGQQGSTGYGCYGGGGGSFVADTANNPVIIAGGGGGAGGLGGNGIDASTGLNGTAGVAGGAGGIGGNGGTAVNTNGGSGGGFYSDGTGSFYMPQCSTSVGTSFISGGVGGQFDFWLPGGFGGGGSGWDGNGNGGGGGGYSGGGTSGTSYAAGGGAGSFNSGSNQVNLAGANTGDGEVIITQINTTGISTIKKDLQLNLYPNPNNGTFTVELPEADNAVITVRNMIGETILTKTATLINPIELNEVSGGVYQLSVTINGVMVCNKSFVKQ